jgi:hypothetical protein
MLNGAEQLRCRRRHGEAVEPTSQHILRSERMSLQWNTQMVLHLDSAYQTYGIREQYGGMEMHLYSSSMGARSLRYHLSDPQYRNYVTGLVRTKRCPARALEEHVVHHTFSSVDV